MFIDKLIFAQWEKELFRFLSLRQVMRIALPNGAENGIHQLVKVALSSCGG